MSEKINTWQSSRFYDRYGGFMQSYPLTADEQKYDDTCRFIDSLEVEIGAMSTSLFTADELTWFMWFRGKVFLFPKQLQLDGQLQTLTKLRDRLKSRCQ